VFAYDPAMSDPNATPVSFQPVNDPPGVARPTYMLVSGTAGAMAAGAIEVTVTAYFTPAGGVPTPCGSTTLRMSAAGPNHYTLPDGCLELLANGAPLDPGTMVRAAIVAGANTTLDPSDFFSITVLELETHGT
jgi:hypothetical protein